jgi:type I restriction enzyme S subunit
MFSRSDYIKANALYTTLPIINNSYLSNVYIPLPPPKEQTAIAAFLDTRCRRINHISAKKQQAVETIKAYKKSLIYEYVTGKKRVKGYL